jgi:hypothetical protein
MSIDLSTSRITAELEVRQAWHAQLRKLAELQADWNGYGAEPIRQPILAAAHSLADWLPTEAGRLSQVVPMTRGRLQWEWHRGQKSLELELETPTTIRFLQWNPRQNVEVEDSVEVTDRDAIAGLIAWFVAE